MILFGCQAGRQPGPSPAGRRRPTLLGGQPEAAKSSPWLSRHHVFPHPPQQRLSSPSTSAPHRQAPDGTSHCADARAALPDANRPPDIRDCLRHRRLGELAPRSRFRRQTCGPVTNRQRPGARAPYPIQDFKAITAGDCSPFVKESKTQAKCHRIPLFKRFIFKLCRGFFWLSTTSQRRLHNQPGAEHAACGIGSRSVSGGPCVTAAILRIRRRPWRWRDNRFAWFPSSGLGSHCDSRRGRSSPKNPVVTFQCLMAGVCNGLSLLPASAMPRKHLSFLDTPAGRGFIGEGPRAARVSEDHAGDVGEAVTNIRPDRSGWMLRLRSKAKALGRMSATRHGGMIALVSRALRMRQATA